jgi:xylulokinase
MKVAGIDVGSTNIKALIISPTDKGKIYTIKKPTPIIFNDEFLDIKPIVQETISLVREIKDKYDVKFIGFSTMAPVLVLVNSDLEPIGALMYNSLVGSEYFNMFDEDLFLRINLNPLNAQMVFQKILWLKNRYSSLFEKIRYFMDLNGYIFMKLTGEIKQDTHIALEWGLLDHKSRSWSEEILETVGLKDIVSKLPALVEPTYNINNIAIGTVDVVASALALIANKKRAFASYGTTFCAGVGSDSPKPSRSFYNDLFLDYGYLINGCNSMYGSLIDWFKGNILKESKYDFKVEEVSESAINIIFLPYLQGERSPIFDPKASGVIYGLKINNDIRDLWTALVHALAYVAANIIESLSQNSIEIVSYGGLARKPIINIVSSLLGRRQYKINIEAAALGAAIIAARAGNVDIDFDSIVNSSIISVIEPVEKLRSTHMKNYEVFKNLYLKLRDLFQTF